MRRLTAALALGLILPRGARPAVLERVEVVEDGGPVVRLHVSEPVKPVAHPLAAGANLPDRIYLDLPVTGTGPAAPAVTRGVGPLLRVRTARFDAGTVRVVLDLAAALPFTLETDAHTVIVRLGQGRTEAAPAPPPASQPEAAPAAEPAGPPPPSPSAAASPSPPAAPGPPPAVASEPATEPLDLPTRPPTPPTEPEAPARATKPRIAAAEAPRAAPEPPGPTAPPANPPAPQPPAGTDRHGSSERALPLIIIDPGHGGHDPGAAGVGGVVEKDVVLDIARRLAVKLATRLPVSVVLTRLDDSYVPIERRVPEVAEAALFLSLHANACHDASARGVEVFYGGGNGGLPGNLAANRAMLLGRAVESALATVVGGVRGDARPGTFAVLARNAVPGVLVEIGYLTHPGDAARACDGAYQELLTDALVEGVRDFLRVSAPLL